MRFARGVLDDRTAFGEDRRHDRVLRRRDRRLVEEDLDPYELVRGQVEDAVDLHLCPQRAQREEVGVESPPPITSPPGGGS